MQQRSLIIIALLIVGCMETPEFSTTQEEIAKEQINSNKTEAQKAQEEYLALQKQREGE